MSQTDPWTIGHLLKWTTDYLRDIGSETPDLDSQILLAEARGCQRIDLFTAFNEPASEHVRTAFRELVRRRAEGMPVAYLVGRREFYSLSFRVTPDVLIPRPETELVVVTLLDRIKERQQSDQPVTIADVGTGSGVIAVCTAREVPNSRVTAIDCSNAALEVARANAADYQVADRIDFIQGDLLSELPETTQFDFIASNPPYVSTSEFDTLAADVKDHEPQTALVAGPQGTELIERLIPQAAERLQPGGWLLMEISPMIEQAVDRLIQAEDQFEQGPTIKDFAGHARVVQAKKL